MGPFSVFTVFVIVIYVFGAVDKTSSSFSAHGKIGNFIIIIITSTLMTHNSFCLSVFLILIYTSLVCNILFKSSPPGCLLTFLLATLKINSSGLNVCHLARNLGFIFDEQISFTELIDALSHICQLRCIRHYLDFKTASTIATSIVYSKLDCCNSLYYNLSNSQLKHL